MKRTPRSTVFLALLAACGDGLPDQRMESEHFTVYHREEAELCEGILDELEAHRAALVDWLGTEGPRHIHYYVFSSKEDLQERSKCGRRCTILDDGRVEIHTYYPYSLDQHELVHAYLNGLSDPPVVLSEGLAVALECFRGDIARPDISLGDLLSQGPLYPETVYYDAAGYLVRYMLDAYGKDRLVEFYLATNGLSNTDLPGVFEDFFGQELAEAWEIAITTVDRWRVASCVCPLGGAKINEETIGGGAQGCRFLSQVVFEVGENAVRLDVFQPENLTVELTSCFGDRWAPHPSNLFATPAAPPTGREGELVTKVLYASLDPGRYAMTLQSEDVLTAKVFETQAMGTHCEALDPDPIDPRAMNYFSIVYKKEEQPYLGLSLTESAVTLHPSGAPYSPDSSDPACSICGEADRECSIPAEWPEGEVWLRMDGTRVFPEKVRIAPSN